MKENYDVINEDERQDDMVDVTVTELSPEEPKKSGLGKMVLLGVAAIGGGIALWSKRKEIKEARREKKLIKAAQLLAESGYSVFPNDCIRDVVDVDADDFEEVVDETNENE